MLLLGKKNPELGCMNQMEDFLDLLKKIYHRYLGLLFCKNISLWFTIRIQEEKCF